MIETKIIENEICMIKGCDNPVTDKDYVMIVWDDPESPSVRICKEHIEFSGKCNLEDFKPLRRYRCIECDEMIEGIYFDDHCCETEHQLNVKVNYIQRMMKSVDLPIEDLVRVLNDRKEKGKNSAGELVL